MFESPQSLLLNYLDLDAFDAVKLAENWAYCVSVTSGSRRGKASTLSILSPWDMLAPRVLLKRAFGEGPPSDADNSAQLGTNCSSSKIQLELLVCFLQYTVCFLHRDSSCQARAARCVTSNHWRSSSESAALRWLLRPYVRWPEMDDRRDESKCNNINIFQWKNINKLALVSVVSWCSVSVCKKE